MASIIIHLAIGKRYLEKTKTPHNEHDFMHGIVAPDLAPDKRVSHYAGEYDEQDLIRGVEQKVQLSRFLASQQIDSDYSEGYFLHLATDYLFFNKFFAKEDLMKVTHDDFFRNLYYSYDKVNEYISGKYHVSYGEYEQQINERIAEKQQTIPDGPKIDILPIDRLDDFIEEVSDINLKEYRRKIITASRNIFP